MKKIILIIFVAIGFFIPAISFAQEKIDSFNAEIRINANASIDVKEQINWDFDAMSNKHGIFRDIPIKYAARGGNFNLRISDISVADENGTPYNFSTSYPGNNIELKIGDQDITVSGQKTYVINYKINRAINYFSDYDELYWNVTGNGWQVPIEESSAKVILPQSISKDQLQSACFAGILGSNASCKQIDFTYQAGDRIANIDYNQPNLLGPGEGLTIVVGWPPGFVAKPSALQNILDIIKDNWILFLPLITFLVMFYLWLTRGRDPKGRGTIVAQYDAPDNLTPAEIGTLIDEKVDTKDISSEIVYLATKGYLKITRTENKGIIFKHEDYLLEKLKDQTDLGAPDKRLMDGLFQYATAKSTKLSDLKNKFYKELPDIKNRIFDFLVSKGYFPKSPLKVKQTYIIVGTLAMVGVMLSAEIFTRLIPNFGVIGFISVFLSGLIILIFGSVMPVKTKRGVDTKENILGLKEYLQVAEKDRIKFFNAPEKNPQHFEALLPYAMVLGVEREWAKQFEGIYNQPPSWYSDPTGGTFNSLILINGLNNFSHSANTALTIAPRSAAGGGSGFGGGGFSGGGFGGGGGGSW